ncbi:hypothetical protein FRC12_004657 [Ceratobasidium sp. 428]|nr:hypothetical protein FRC12_004657 [Ceratobasidium sp. 428]
MPDTMPEELDRPIFWRPATNESSSDSSRLITSIICGRTTPAGDTEESDDDDAQGSETTEGSEAETTERSEEEATDGPEEVDTDGSEAEVEEALEVDGVAGSGVYEARGSVPQTANPGLKDAILAARNSKSHIVDTSAQGSACAASP